MSLVQAKCTNCGGILEVDNSNDAAVCKYCGTPFIVEKAVNNYVQNISIENATINVQGADVNNYIQLIEDALKKNDLKDADKYLHDALPLDPQNIKLIFFKKEIKILYLLEDTVILVNNALIELKKSGVSINKNRQNEISQILADFSKIIPKDLLNMTDDFVDSCQNIFASDDEIKNDYCCLVLTVLVNYLRTCSNIQSLSIKEQKEVSAFGLMDIYFFITSEIYKVLVSPYVPIAEIENRLVDLIEIEKDSRYHFKFLGQPVPDEIKNTSDKVVVKDKKGNEKQARFYGSYVVYYMKKNHPGYESKTLDEIQKMMAAKEKSGCYVATCVYGSYDCPEVWTLRRFRDYTLDTTWYGRLFIKTYYAISPTAVKWFGDYKWFKGMFKKPLDNMIKRLSEKGYENTPYNDKY